MFLTDRDFGFHKENMTNAFYGDEYSVKERLNCFWVFFVGRCFSYCYNHELF